MLLKRNFVRYFSHSIYSFKRAYNDGRLYFCQILTESVVFSRRNPRFGPKLCSGSGKEQFKDLLTSLIVSRSATDSLIFLFDLFEFILHIVVTH